MSAAKKWIAIVAGVVLVMVAAVVAFLDPLVRYIVVQQVTATSGRQLTIQGDFDVDLFPWPPRVRAEAVTFANAEWGTEPMMLEVEVLEFEIEVMPLLRGQIVAPEVILTSPRVVLERNRDGRRNWILSREQTGRESGTRIGRLVVNGGSLIYRDPVANTELFLGLATNQDSTKPATATTFSVNGRLRGVPLSASGSGGEVLALRDTSQPFPIDARFQFGGVRGTIDGTVAGLTALDSFDLAVTMSGKNLAQLKPLIDVPFGVPGFKVSGRFAHDAQRWSVNRLDASIGESHLAGSLQIDLAGAKPSFGGSVTSKVLDIDTLERMFESNSKAASASKDGWIKRLGDFNGELRFAIERVRNAPLPLDGATGTLQVKSGVATVDL
ncbi:MAG: AsmA family protein, partial [Burkholderiaceae bacterium]